jgi:RecA/RadA recombinase
MQTPGRLSGDAPNPSLASALARLESRWGTAAIRLGNGDRVDTRGPATARDAPPTLGALALVPQPDERPGDAPGPLTPTPAEVLSTGFPELDAVLGSGGLPRQASAALLGDASSGKTTLALRCAAEAQDQGAIVAWLDLAEAFDPLEAVSRGVDLRWLLVVRPVDAAEGFALAGALLAGRALDLLVIDLPAQLAGRHEAVLRRLTAHARRIGARLVVLEPPSLTGALHGALVESTSLRLELARQAWIRLGRDIVGQQTAVTVAKNRFGVPGRRVELEIHYADDGDRAAPDRLLAARPRRAPRELSPPPTTLEETYRPTRPAGAEGDLRRDRHTRHATAVSRLATSPAPPGGRPSRAAR